MIPDGHNHDAAILGAATATKCAWNTPVIVGSAVESTNKVNAPLEGSFTSGTPASATS
jgi:hypothetical protein